MSASMLDTASASLERPPEWAPPTADLDSTSDLHEEDTTDLAPVTEDVTPTGGSAPSSTHQARAPAADSSAARAQERRAQSAISAQVPEQSPPETPAAMPPTLPSPGVESATAAAAAERAAESGLSPGTVLCERYLIEQIVGCGGTAVVYRARDILPAKNGKANARIAIKIPRPEVTDRTRAAARIRHEFEHAKRLSHPNIVRVLQLHEDGERCFMAMELIEGRLLSQLVRDWTMLSPPLTHKILRACAQALAHAHGRDVVHGDFKPGNVFVTASEDIKVVDFGAAAGTPDESTARIPAGTPAYASPEVLSGETPEPRDDVFSFACVAYELLTGQHPFERQSSLRARDEGMIPPRAWSLSAQQWLALLSALSWEREQRPASIDSLQAALTPQSQPVSESAPIHAPPGTATSGELAPELMPRQSSWGFFVFIACALAVIFIASQRQGEPGHGASRSDGPVSDATASVAALPPPASLAADVAKLADRNASGHLPPPAPAAKATASGNRSASAATSAAVPRTREVRAARSDSAALSEISFESASIVTTEGSVAAVFLIKRSQPLTDRVRVRWRAVSGTADAGIDFASSAAGTVEFASGQAQRAIYVPLRDDLLEEGDETFTLELQSPQGARLGPVSTAEATIRDDD